MPVKGSCQGIYLRTVFCHSAESWTQMWEEQIFEKGQVKVNTVPQGHNHDFREVWGGEFRPRKELNSICLIGLWNGCEGGMSDACIYIYGSTYLDEYKGSKSTSIVYSNLSQLHEGKKHCRAPPPTPTQRRNEVTKSPPSTKGSSSKAKQSQERD
jgi:hypothetical protein